MWTFQYASISATGNFSYGVRCKTGCYAVLSGGNADVTVIYA